jgi:hypothetical protein
MEAIPVGVPLNFFGGAALGWRREGLPKKYKTLHPYRDRLQTGRAS